MKYFNRSIIFSLLLINLFTNVFAQDINERRQKLVGDDKRELLIYFENFSQNRDIRIYLNDRFIGKPDESGIFARSFKQNDYTLKIVSNGYREAFVERQSDKPLPYFYKDISLTRDTSVELYAKKCCLETDYVLKWLKEGQTVYIDYYNERNEVLTRELVVGRYKMLETRRNRFGEEANARYVTIYDRKTQTRTYARASGTLAKLYEEDLPSFLKGTITNKPNQIFKLETKEGLTATAKIQYQDSSAAVIIGGKLVKRIYRD